jgi:hypothetical protein
MIEEKISLWSNRELLLLVPPAPTNNCSQISLTYTYMLTPKKSLGSTNKLPRENPRSGNSPTTNSERTKLDTESKRVLIELTEKQEK